MLISISVLFFLRKRSADNNELSARTNFYRDGGWLWRIWAKTAIKLFKIFKKKLTKSLYEQRNDYGYGSPVAIRTDAKDAQTSHFLHRWWKRPANHALSPAYRSGRSVEALLTAAPTGDARSPRNRLYQVYETQVESVSKQLIAHFDRLIDELDNKSTNTPTRILTQSLRRSKSKVLVFDNDGYADGDVAWIGTAEPQTASESGRYCLAPGGERGKPIQRKPLLRRKVCGA